MPKRQARGERLIEKHVRLPLELWERIEGRARKESITAARLLRATLEAHFGLSEDSRGARDAA